MASARTSIPSVTEAVGLLRTTPYEELDELIARFGNDSRRQVQRAVGVAMRRQTREAQERRRVAGMYAYQRELGGTGIVLGVDEVGRGAIAGPLTVAAVALPEEMPVWGLDDSKRLTSSKREELAARISEVAVAIGLAQVEATSIDAVGMAVALRMAMAAAIADAGVEPDAVLIDGNPVHVHERETCVVKGDQRVACIAAASIVAKVTRDALMRQLDASHPGYHLAACKGYASAAHVDAVRQLGPSPIHRVSFCSNFLRSRKPVH